MSWMGWLKRQLKQLRLEMLANQRLRWGLFSIAVLSLLYITLVLDDVQENLLTEFRNLSLQKRELITIEPDSVWQQRVSQETRLLKEKAIAVWQAETEALVRAKLQSSVNGYAEAAHLQRINMQVGSFQPHGELAGVNIVRLELDVLYTDDKVLDFIGSVESAAPMLKIVRMSLRTGKRNNRAQMMILAYFSPLLDTGS